jgi:hypothetical protein
MNSVSENGSDFIQDLGDAVRKNPLSAALIGMGVLWFFTAGKPMDRASEFARNTGLDRVPGTVGEALGTARSALSSTTDAVGERMTSVTNAAKDGAADTLDSAVRYGRDYAGSASEYLSSIPAAGSGIFEDIRSNLSEVFKAQPLALGAIGIAIGAGIAAALPATEVEADYLGEASDAAKARASEFAADQADRAVTVGENVANAVREEARKQGLTMEGARSAGGDISAKIGRVVQAAGKGVSERVTLSKS